MRDSSAAIVSRVEAAAIETFGDAEFACEWLNLPNPALGDRIPLELVRTDGDVSKVEAVLARIAHGVYS